ncbi:DUF3363 domain-containing protein [Mesorhizobium sp. B2-4-17]|uniref:DUF3363 domain-containing protein n=1 Tax=Mesorhizobium sp. B2-4-17 TaxID=2589932 RepID=UPI0015E44D0A|nr:DUF3363 domain-containing protein [Mesorhizobium sp. B2-4-17]
MRRPEALRRASIVERIDADHWKIPNDIAGHGAAYDTRSHGMDFIVRTLSFLDLDSQVTSDGATWLDPELASPNRTSLAQAGFGRRWPHASTDADKASSIWATSPDRPRAACAPRATCLNALNRPRSPASAVGWRPSAG